MKAPEQIFKEYDIRGLSGSELTPEIITAIGRAIGSELREQGGKDIVIGRDGRLSSLSYHQALAFGLCHAGCNVIDVGMVPTPVVWYAEHALGVDGGVVITASHNPREYNGIKLSFRKQPFCGAGLKKLYDRVTSEDYAQSEIEGRVRATDIRKNYLQYIREQTNLARSLRIGIDCGNGATGELAPVLFRALGCDVRGISLDIDGRFPSHDPDPTNHRNLRDLIQLVKDEHLDIGLAFDGDGDRLVAVSSAGNVILADRLLMLFARDVLPSNPGATVVYDVKSSRLVEKEVSALGGIPVMWKTGYPFIRRKMLETNALLGAELAGHFFFRDKWPGFDDGLYAATRLLEILSREKGKSNDLLDDLPMLVSTPEVRLELSNKQIVIIEDRLKRLYQDSSNSIKTKIFDGFRIEHDKGWILLRRSQTQPAIVVRIEAEDLSSFQFLQKEMEAIFDVIPTQSWKRFPDLGIPSE